MPFAESFLEHVQPVPGVVEWDFNGARDAMEACMGIFGFLVMEILM